MTRRLTAAFFGLSVLGLSIPLIAESGGKQPVQVTGTERFSFAPGGVIRITTSSSNLMVEAWDRPEVEVTTVKSTRHSYEADRHDQASRCLDNVQVVSEHSSGTELVISEKAASHHFFADLFGSKCGITMQLEIRAPRDSRLVIHHGAGYVLVSRVMGEIEATSRSGDIMLMLPDPGPYSIDAKSKIGDVSSDFEGASHSTNLVGEQFARSNPPPSHRIYLRMGLGDITIKEVPPTPEAPVAADVP